MKKLKRTCRDCGQSRLEGRKTYCGGGFDPFKVVRATRKTAANCIGWSAPIGYHDRYEG